MTSFNCCHSDDWLSFFVVLTVVATFPKTPMSIEYFSGLWSNVLAVCFAITLVMLLTVATNNHFSISDFLPGM